MKISGNVEEEGDLNYNTLGVYILSKGHIGNIATAYTINLKLSWVDEVDIQMTKRQPATAATNGTAATGMYPLSAFYDIPISGFYDSPIRWFYDITTPGFHESQQVRVIENAF